MWSKSFSFTNFSKVSKAWNGGLGSLFFQLKFTIFQHEKYPFSLEELDARYRVSTKLIRT